MPFRASFPGRLLILLIGVLALLATGSAVPVAAAPGVPPGEPPQRTLTYEVRTRGTVQADLGAFRRIAAATFNDRRGWSLGGSLRYREVPSGGDFTLWLAAPSSMPTFSSVCSAQYSCRVGRNVIINDERWRRGTSTWPAVREYRHYVLNHELGHWHGQGHSGCSGPGALAPVMQQQSIALDGCRSNTWPLESERRAAAGRHGVQVRSERPDLYAVDHEGGSGTDVHALDGRDLWRTFQTQIGTALGRTSPSAWSFTVADRNRDGVDDVIGVLRTGGSGRTEVHVLDGASGWRSFQLHAVTALGRTSAAGWSFDVADVDGDGWLDVLAFAHAGGSGRTEVHVLDGETGYRTWLAHVATPLGATDPANWVLAAGHHDRDGVPDVYAINRRGSSSTEVHVLGGSSGYRAWVAHRASALHRTDAQWDFAVGDDDGDGWDDVFAVRRGGGSGRTEVHVLADRTYSGFSVHAATGLGSTAGAPDWRFAVD